MVTEGVTGGEGEEQRTASAKPRPPAAGQGHGPAREVTNMQGPPTKDIETVVQQQPTPAVIVRGPGEGGGQEEGEGSGGHKA